MDAIGRAVEEDPWGSWSIGKKAKAAKKGDIVDLSPPEAPMVPGADKDLIDVDVGLQQREDRVTRGVVLLRLQQSIDELLIEGQISRGAAIRRHDLSEWEPTRRCEAAADRVPQPDEQAVGRAPEDPSEQRHEQPLADHRIHLQ